MKNIIDYIKTNNRKMIIIISGWIMFIFLLFLTSFETSAEKMERLREEIEIVKMKNISFANLQIDWLKIEVQQLETQVQKKKNDIFIYEECKKLNEIKDIPINCKDITIDLESDLWWEVNQNWLSQEYMHLIWDTPKIRAEYLLDWFTHTKWTIDIWIELWKKYKIDPYLAISIAKADSNLWNQLKSINNIGNVWNNDRWNTIEYKTKEDGIEAIFKVLNNKYLWNIYTVWYLSCWGKKNLWIQDCFQNNEKVYATSKENRNNNVLNTLRNIYRDPSIDESYNFRK